MKIKGLTIHAKKQLLSRFNLRKIPQGPRTLICNVSTNKRLYRIGEVYFIWSKTSKKIITFLTREIAIETWKFHKKKDDQTL